MNKSVQSVIFRVFIVLSMYVIMTIYSINCMADTPHIEKGDSIKLNKIELQKNSVLYDILLNTIVQDSLRNHADIYHVNINGYKSGYFIWIVKSKSNMLKTTSPYSGYAMLNDYTFVFGFANYKLNMSKNHNSRFFKSSKAKQFFSEEAITTQWYYYILDDIYARFDPESGWIWSDGKPDE